MTRNKRTSRSCPAFYGARFFIRLSAVLLFAITGCKNDSSIIGLDVQPESDRLHQGYVDTSTVISFTRKQDSLITSDLPYQLLGSYNDSLFGKAYSSIYMQLTISNANPDFGTTPVLDSAVLALAYDPLYYGHFDQQTLNVFQLTQEIYVDSTYYSNRIFNYNYIDLCNAQTFIPKPTDSIVVWGVKAAPQLRIKLSNTFGQNLLDNSTQMTDDASFRNFFKGLYVTTANALPLVNTGGIFRFMLYNPNSKLTLYYHNSSSDSLRFDLVYGSNCQSSLYFDHNYSTVPAITNQFSDSTQGQNFIYLQAMSGLRSRIHIPYLKNYANNGGIAVNKAELILKADPNTISTSYAAPLNLVLEGIDDAGKPYAMPDAIDASHYYGGAYDAVNHTYTFNISRQVQAIIAGKTINHGFNLVVSGGSLNMNRLLLGGGGNSSYKMTFKITYTKL